MQRVVSLVPSLTETVASTAPGLLVGATDWCTHPADLDVVRIGGTKSPDVGVVAALSPDLVLANEEENRTVDLEALRREGIDVLVTHVRTLDEAFTELHRVLDACGANAAPWLAEARAAWTGATPAWAGERRRAVVPIWRRPWMAVGRDTFMGDVLRRLGVDNVLVADSDRYPRIDPAHLPPHDLVVLPDEPYAFSMQDGPEAFVPTDCALVSGRHLTWYGPSLIEAVDVLTEQLRSAARA